MTYNVFSGTLNPTHFTSLWRSSWRLRSSFSVSPSVNGYTRKRDPVFRMNFRQYTRLYPGKNGKILDTDPQRCVLKILERDSSTPPTRSKIQISRFTYVCPVEVTFEYLKSSFSVNIFFSEIIAEAGTRDYRYAAVFWNFFFCGQTVAHLSNCWALVYSSSSSSRRQKQHRATVAEDVAWRGL